MNASGKDAERLIKRYGNRKLYDVEASRYVTLDGVRALVQSGADVRVVDNDSGEDLTRATLAQIIYEAERRTGGGPGALSLPVLRRLIQFGDGAVRDLRRGVERGREALVSARDAAEQRVQDLVGRTGKSTRPGSLLGDFLDRPQRTLGELQRRIDTQVRQSVDRVAQHPTLRAELKRIERSLRQIEARLAPAAGKRPRSRRRSKS